MPEASFLASRTEPSAEALFAKFLGDRACGAADWRFLLQRISGQAASPRRDFRDDCSLDGRHLRLCRTLQALYFATLRIPLKRFGHQVRSWDGLLVFLDKHDFFIGGEFGSQPSVQGRSTRTPLAAFAGAQRAGLPAFKDAILVGTFEEGAGAVRGCSAHVIVAEQPQARWAFAHGANIHQRVVRRRGGEVAACGSSRRTPSRANCLCHACATSTRRARGRRRPSGPTDCSKHSLGSRCLRASATVIGCSAPARSSFSMLSGAAWSCVTAPEKEFSRRGFRAGRAAALASSGVPLGDLLKADEWRSASFLRYVDLDAVDHAQLFEEAFNSDCE